MTIPLVVDDAALERAFSGQFAAGVDVVIDYLWGRSAELLLSAAAKTGQAGRSLRYVQIGSASGSDIKLPSAVLRSIPIELMGSGLGSVRPDRLLHAIDGVLQAAGPGGFKIAVRPAPLAEVERAWAGDEGAGRTVLTMR